MNTTPMTKRQVVELIRDGRLVRTILDTMSPPPFILVDGEGWIRVSSGAHFDPERGWVWHYAPDRKPQ